MENLLRAQQASRVSDRFDARDNADLSGNPENLSAAKSAYGNIVYRKAPSFLRQAEFYLGEDKFQTAVRAFLKKHEFANAEWTNLVKEFETASKKDLTDWANFWVKQKGLFKIKLKNGFLKFNINKFLVTADIEHSSVKNYEQVLRTMEFRALFVKEDGTRETKDITLNPFYNWRIDVYGFDKEPILIFPNYQDYGYGIFLLDERSRAYVLANIQTEKDDFLRTMMWGALWDSVRESELNPKDYVELVIKNINVETDESTIQTLLGRVSTAMNYYLSEPSASAGGLNAIRKTSESNVKPSANADGTDKPELVAQIENLLINKMQNAPTLGQRITFYRAFLSIASTDKARTFLKDVLSGKLAIKDLQLKSKDRFDIVTRLTILGDKDAPQLLANLEKLEMSDEAKRYAYAAKAGIATAENKAKFWNDFINNKDISESYIESAFTAFNSPRQADLTLMYLEKALSELPNLKRNRKIFFVNGWLSAFIGGQKSEQALQIINKFLADNSSLDRDLRLKILENSDNLERAVKIRAKYGSL